MLDVQIPDAYYNRVLFSSADWIDKSLAETASEAMQRIQSSLDEEAHSPTHF